MLQQLNRTDEMPIWSLWSSNLVISAIALFVEMNLFEALKATGKSSNELSIHFKLPKKSLNYWLSILYHCELLNYELGTWSLTERCRFFLDPSQETYWGHAFLHDYQFSSRFCPIKKLFKQDSKLIRPWDKDQNSEPKLLQFLRFVDASTYTSALKAAANLQISPTFEVLEVGSGLGAFSRAILKYNPNLRFILLDLPHVIHAVQSHQKFPSEFCFLGADMWKETWPEVDQIIMSNILHDWSLNECENLFKIASKSAKRLAILEILEDGDLHDLATASLGIKLHYSVQGMNHNWFDLEKRFEKTGWKAQLHPKKYGPYRLIEAFFVDRAS